MSRTIRLGTETWAFDTWRDCTADNEQRRFTDKLSATHWAARFKVDSLAMASVRGLLAESEPTTFSHRITNDTALSHLGSLLASGRLHAHPVPLPVIAGKSAADAAAPADAAFHAPPPRAKPVVVTAHLIVRVRNPLDVPLYGVTVEVAGLGHRATGADGRADFGTVPPATYNITTHKTDYGPLPIGATPFAIGNATASQAVPAGATVTAEVRMVTVTLVRVSHTPVVAATPLRIYKQAIADTDTDHPITCTALCPRTAGNGPGTQYIVRVDWTFTAPAANAPRAKGGKDNSSTHFAAVAGGPAMSGGGTTTASTLTNDAGATQIMLRASVTSGDQFIVHAKVLRDPSNVAAGDLGHDNSPNFRVWKKLVYNNLFRMRTGANVGYDVDTAATVAHVGPAFDPTYTEYSKGATHPLAYQEYITDLIPPTPAQLPINGKVVVHSDGDDTRIVKVHGLVVAADGSTSAGSEDLTLNGTTAVPGVKDFQKINMVSVPVSPTRMLTVDSSTGGRITILAPHNGSIHLNFLLDTPAAVKVKAQAWYDANQDKIGTDMQTLYDSLHVPGHALVGAAYFHPKMDGRPATGKTSYYAGYPGVQLHYPGYTYHPDQNWEPVQGVNGATDSLLSLMFLNIKSSARAVIVARHEIAHSSDHVSYGDGDHCPRASCLMSTDGGDNAFCTAGADHSLRRTEGWSR